MTESTCWSKEVHLGADGVCLSLLQNRHHRHRARLTGPLFNFCCSLSDLDIDLRCVVDPCTTLTPKSRPNIALEQP